MVGFDYGYALAANTLNHLGSTIWDFSNGAMIDQYISCGRQMEQSKRNCLLLPHTVMKVKESTPRLEWNVIYNFEHNMYVADCTTPVTFSLVANK
jgi:2-oxoglutarate dehydrogenase complex dehydrogenase (E1) component-like enzyme